MAFSVTGLTDDPPVKQFDKSMVMFLSSLRVAASPQQEMKDDPTAQDALLHVFDLMASFPPALRTASPGPRQDSFSKRVHWLEPCLLPYPRNIHA